MILQPWDICFTLHSTKNQGDEGMLTACEAHVTVRCQYVDQVQHIIRGCGWGGEAEGELVVFDSKPVTKSIWRPEHINTRIM